MKYDIKKLYYDIIDVENKLNKFVDNQEEYDKIYEQSVIVDRVIAKYIEAKKYLEDERRRIVKDYEKILNQPYKEEVINQIKEEVKNDFPNIQEKELDHFSNNVYVCAILKAYNINEQEIVDQLLYLNNKYFDEMQEDRIVKDSEIKEANFEYLKALNDKYTKIIKEKM